MRSSTARRMHASTNLAYWMEKPDWSSGDARFDALCKVMRLLPFSAHELQKRLFFDTSGLLAVSGETVVVVRDDDQVDKFMLRRPKSMNLEGFNLAVAGEVDVVTGYLAGIALPTVVGVKTARIFRNHRSSVEAVTQTQPRLNLLQNPPLNVAALNQLKDSAPKDRTARDLARHLAGAKLLIERHGLFPDTSTGSGNLRRNILNGAVTLIDVTPIHADGNRLIDDRPPDAVARIEENLQHFRDFVGQYGG